MGDDSLVGNANSTKPESFVIYINSYGSFAFNQV